MSQIHQGIIRIFMRMLNCFFNRLGKWIVCIFFRVIKRLVSMRGKSKYKDAIVINVNSSGGLWLGSKQLKLKKAIPRNVIRKILLTKTKIFERIVNINFCSTKLSSNKASDWYWMIENPQARRIVKRLNLYSIPGKKVNWKSNSHANWNRFKDGRSHDLPNRRETKWNTVRRGIDQAGRSLQ